MFCAGRLDQIHAKVCDMHTIGCAQNFAKKGSVIKLDFYVFYGYICTPKKKFFLI